MEGQHRPPKRDRLAIFNASSAPPAMMGDSIIDPDMQNLENSASDGVISPGWRAPLGAAQRDQSVQVDGRPGGAWPVSSPTVQGGLRVTPHILSRHLVYHVIAASCRLRPLLFDVILGHGHGLLLCGLVSPPCPICTTMTVTTTPQWQQGVARKRHDRDEAIRRFLDAQSAASEVRLLSGLCGSALTLLQTLRSTDVDQKAAGGATSQETSFDRIVDLLGAISAGSMTATELCTAYIQR